MFFFIGTSVCHSSLLMTLSPLVVPIPLISDFDARAPTPVPLSLAVTLSNLDDMSSFSSLESILFA